MGLVERLHKNYLHFDLDVLNRLFTRFTAASVGIIPALAARIVRCPCGVETARNVETFASNSVESLTLATCPSPEHSADLGSNRKLTLP